MEQDWNEIIEEVAINDFCKKLLLIIIIVNIASTAMIISVFLLMLV